MHKSIKHPTKAQVKAVVDNFVSILPLTVDNAHHLNMMSMSICGSTHCHGGWYWVAKNGDHAPNGIGINMGYEAGTESLAIDLGFDDDSDLQAWAAYYPGIWGNEHGSKMFVNEIAFTCDLERPYGAQNLQDIINHWTDVMNRLPE